MDTPNEKTLHEKYGELVNKFEILSLMFDSLERRIAKAEATIKRISPKCLRKNLSSDEEDIYY